MTLPYALYIPDPDHPGKFKFARGADGRLVGLTANCGCCGGGGVGDCVCCFVTATFPLNCIAAPRTAPFTCCEMGNFYTTEASETAHIQGHDIGFTYVFDSYLRNKRSWDCPNNGSRCVLYDRVIHEVTDGSVTRDESVHGCASVGDTTLRPFTRPDDNPLMDPQQHPYFYFIENYYLSIGRPGPNGGDCSGSYTQVQGNVTTVSTWNITRNGCSGMSYTCGVRRTDPTSLFVTTVSGYVTFVKVNPCLDASGDICVPCTSSATSGQTASDLLSQSL